MFETWGVTEVSHHFKPQCGLVSSLKRAPVTSSNSSVQALVDGIEESSPAGRIWTQAHVEQILVENNRAAGLRLRDGTEIRAREAASRCFGTSFLGGNSVVSIAAI